MNRVRVGVGGIVEDTQGRILLLKRSKSPEAGCWSIPGGAIEYGETAENAILRELREETGLTDCTADFIGYTDYILKVEESHWCSLFFVIRSNSGTAANMEPDKHKSMGWFFKESVPVELTQNTMCAIKIYKEWNGKELQK